ncbi:Angiotensin-converting enzyme [Camponotus floridanus]|uniref:Angiotensin-converting enzyme n=1 Tax=Camponotus floridanus TaxID=104421 RepID=E2ASH0_CAMFO|nr:Angiotensin-converting enzyme [Camponotus floridanus]
MKEIYIKARVCPYKQIELNGECNLTLDYDINKIMAQSKDYDELLYYWHAWHEATGPQLQNKYLRYVQLANRAAKLNGFADAGDQMRELFEDEYFQQNIAEVMSAISPLYKNLFTYVRSKLIERYGNRIREDGPLPAHVLGNMWAQNWEALFDLVQPFPASRKLDVTVDIMIQSITPMRIKQCTRDTMEDLLSTHYEMTHLQYYLQYKDHPLLFRNEAMPGFYEAVSDAIGLSVFTPQHLHKIGLYKNLTDDYDSSINFLMLMALRKVAYMPFAYIVDQWRWHIFSDGVEDMTARWWELKLQYQGIVPPMPRSERNFDPAAKYHIPADSLYVKYFVSIALQFQLFQSLCEISGHTGELHTCDIYRSREAGRLLSDVLSIGSSRSWQDVIRQMTRGRANRIDAGAMLKYFEPLNAWLKRQNKMQPVIGWITNHDDRDLRENSEEDTREKIRKLKKRNWTTYEHIHTCSGVDIAQMLEYMNFSEKYVDLVRNSSAGNWAITYALYKIFTPLRYTVTVGGTTMAIRHLNKLGYGKAPSFFKRQSAEPVQSNKCAAEHKTKFKAECKTDRHTEPPKP